MTSAERVERDSSEGRISELHIEFSGRQVTIRTDVAEMHDYITRLYQAMLVEHRGNAICSLEFMHVNGGYALRGPNDFEFKGEVSSLYEIVKHELLVPFIRDCQDLLWLHAAAVERHGKALIVAGPSGEGKSTLSTHLCEKGWNFMSDDIAPIRMASNDVLAFPLVPFRRVGGRNRVDRETLETLTKERVLIPPESIRHEAAPIAAIVFPSYEPGARPALERMAAGNAAFELLRSYTNFVDHKDSGVTRASELARTVPAWKITYGEGRDAASVLNLAF